MRTGRPARVNVNRYPSGEIVKAEQKPRETEEQILGIAKWQRTRHLGATEQDYRDQKWSGPLGWMRQWAVQGKDDSLGLSALQYDALTIYIKERTRSYKAQGFKAPFPKSISMEMVASGFESGPSLDDEEIYKLRRVHNAAKSRLLEYPDGPVWVRLIEKLCRDEGEGHEWLRDVGTIRQAANVLVHYYQLTGRRGNLAI